jgi:hypothetical protein
MEILDEQKKWVKSLRNFWHIIGRYNYMKWLEHHKGTIEEIIYKTYGTTTRWTYWYHLGTFLTCWWRAPISQPKYSLSCMDNKKKQRKSLCRFADDMVHCFYVHVYYYIHILVSIHSLVLNSTTFIAHLLLYSIFVISLFHSRWTLVVPFIHKTFRVFLSQLIVDVSKVTHHILQNYCEFS